MVKGPPYAGGLPYLKRSLERWCPANRPGWTGDNIKWTAIALWYGEVRLRDFYRAKIGKKAHYPLFRPDLVPINPWDQNDATFAKNNGSTPPIHGVIPLAPPLPPGFQQVPQPLPPPVPPAPPARTAQPVAPSRPVDVYPYYFWPPKPWDAEPQDDQSFVAGVDVKSIKNNANHLGLWTSTRPFQWRVPKEDNWDNKRFLGGGSFGVAGLWCERDEANNIVKRMVVKESRGFTREYWRDPLYWRDQKPQEIRMHQLVDQGRGRAGVVGYENLIEHQGYRLMMEQRRYRIFLDYYEGGDLYHALWQHFTSNRHYYKPAPQYDDDAVPTIESAATTAIDHDKYKWDHIYQCYRDTNFEDNDPRGLPPIIPESFIWRVVSSLAVACQVLHFGCASQEGEQATVPGWQPITHRDISAANIFMQSSDEDGEFPDLVLADLGLSFTNLDSGDPAVWPHSENPLSYVSMSRDQRYPPEQQFPMELEEGYQHIGEKADVWKIGAVMYYLMHNFAKRGSEGPQRCILSQDEEGEFDDLAPWAGDDGDLGEFDGNIDAEDPWRSAVLFPTFQRYSKESRSLAGRCLNWSPSARPDLLEMRGFIDDFLGNNPDIANDRTLLPAVSVPTENMFKIGQSWGKRRNLWGSGG